MSQQTVTKCDICGKVKGEANKWIKYSCDLTDKTMYIGSHGAKDACSDACIQKVLYAVLDAIRETDHATTASIEEKV